MNACRRPFAAQPSDPGRSRIALRGAHGDQRQKTVPRQGDEQAQQGDQEAERAGEPRAAERESHGYRGGQRPESHPVQAPVALLLAPIPRQHTPATVERTQRHPGAASYSYSCPGCTRASRRACRGCRKPGSRCRGGVPVPPSPRRADATGSRCIRRMAKAVAIRPERPSPVTNTRPARSSVLTVLETWSRSTLARTAVISPWMICSASFIRCASRRSGG